MQPDIVGEAFGHDARPDDADEKEGGTEESCEHAARSFRQSCTTAGGYPTLRHRVFWAWARLAIAVDRSLSFLEDRGRSPELVSERPCIRMISEPV